MALDELLQGLQVFHQGLQEVAQQNAINDAQTKVADIKQQGLDQQKTMQAMSGVAGELTQRLAGLGMSAAAISAVGQSMGPSPDQLMNNDLQQKHLQQQDELTRLHYKTQMDIAKMGNDTKLALKQQGLSGQFDKDINKAVSEFNTKYAKKEMDNMKDLSQAERDIQMAVNNPTVKGIIPIELVRSVGGLSRVNTQELDAMAGSPAIAAKLKQYITSASSGTLTKDNARDFLQLVQSAKQNNLQSLHDKAQTRALQFNVGYGGQVPVDEIYNRFLPKGSAFRMDNPASAPMAGGSPQSASGASGFWSSPGFIQGNGK
jgi:hypothetical protein